MCDSPQDLHTLDLSALVSMEKNEKISVSIVGILHQNFRLFLTLSLPHIIIKEASRYNLVFVP